MPSYRSVPPQLVGGALCIDFINTVTWRGDPVDCGERLTSFDELLIWAGAARAVGRDQLPEIAAAAGASPGRAARALAEAVALREALARLFAGKSRTSPIDLATLNGILRETPRRATVKRASTGFQWDDSGASDPLRRIIASVALSAAGLLTSEELRRVRTCNDARCGWLFLDNSRTARRRWCDMRTCGNRAKARLHYRRVRTSSGRARSVARGRNRVRPISRKR